jgi:hypothetical protein
MAATSLFSRAAKSIVKKTLASLNDPFAPRPPNAFTRDEFKRFVDRYGASADDERKRLSL